MSLFFGNCRRGNGAEMHLSSMVKGRRPNADWPVVWSPRSSLSDESGIEADESPMTPHGRQAVTRAQAVASWLERQAEEAGLESELKLQRSSRKLGLYGSHGNPDIWPECSVQNSPASSHGQRQHRKNSIGLSDSGNDVGMQQPFLRSGEVSLADASLFSSMPSLLEVQPAPILPQEKNTTVEMSGTSLKKGDIPMFNHSVLQSYSGSSVDLTKNTIDVLQGELVSVIHVDNGWAYVVTMDHYCGYVPASYLSKCKSSSDSQATPEEMSNAKNRLGTLDSEASSRSNESPRSSKPKEGPATQLNRMLSPSPSECSSKTLTMNDGRAPNSGEFESAPNVSESVQPADGFWSSSPDASAGLTHKFSRRRTRIPEWKALADSPSKTTPCIATSGDPRDGGHEEPEHVQDMCEVTHSSPNLHVPQRQRHASSPDLAPAVTVTSSAKKNGACRQGSSNSLPPGLSMRQLETPPSSETTWYDAGISPLTPAEPFTRCQGQEVVCLYDFVAEDENDLSVVPGEELTVLNQTDEDWLWVSNSRNEQGFVPANYVRHVAEDRHRPAAASNPVSLQSSPQVVHACFQQPTTQHSPMLQSSMTHVSNTPGQEKGYLV